MEQRGQEMHPQKERTRKKMELKNEESYEIVANTLIKCLDKLLPYLKQSDIYEVYCNPDGSLYTLSNRKGKERLDFNLTPAEAMLIIKNVAALDGRIIDDDRPMLDAKIPANPEFSMCRFNGLMPPIVDQPSFNIRKHATTIYTLDDYLKQGTFTQEQYDITMDCIHRRRNIIVAGGTGSGKTTLINAILAEISKSPDRVVSIEDTNELQYSGADYVPLVASGKVTMADCVINSLRMTPKRIVVGEVRGPEAMSLFTAWSTGHKGGCCTVHSNSAADTMLRLVDMTSQVAKNSQPRLIPGRRNSTTEEVQFGHILRKMAATRDEIPTFSLCYS